MAERSTLRLYPSAGDDRRIGASSMQRENGYTSAFLCFFSVGRNFFIGKGPPTRSDQRALLIVSAFGLAVVGLGLCLFYALLTSDGLWSHERRVPPPTHIETILARGSMLSIGWGVWVYWLSGVACYVRRIRGRFETCGLRCYLMPLLAIAHVVVGVAIFLFLATRRF